MKKIILPAVLLTLACAAQAATIVVNSNADALDPVGVCTLRGAVNAINGGNDIYGCTNIGSIYGDSDTIEFDSLLAGLTIDVTDPAISGGIEIKENLTITGLVDGNGQPDITLDGGGTNRILYAALGSNVTALTITGVKFLNGKASEGGAIFLENEWPNNTLTLKNCVFDNNNATTTDGGAVSTLGEADISDSTFTWNTAYTFGGAVKTDGGGSIVISNSIFSNNTTNNDGGGNHGGGAVAAMNFGGSGGDVIISDSIFHDNHTHTNANYQRGGAVYIERLSNAAIINSTFSDNEAGALGGAVFVLSTTIANIINSTFSDNEAGAHGGAVYVSGATTITNISNSTFSNNKANSNGGAMYLQRSTLTAHHLTLLNNSASTAGQALYFESNNTSQSINLYNSIIIGNNGNSQCANNSGPGSINSSYNLEGWADASGNWQGTDTTCGAVAPVSDGGVTTLSAIITTPLAINGSIRNPPTQTLALSAGSPAIEAADPSGSQMLEIDLSQMSPTWIWADATEDQRGVSRPTTSAERSIGAYERAGGTPPPPSGSGTPIPALPVPLLLALAALVGTAAARQRQRRRC